MGETVRVKGEWLKHDTWSAAETSFFKQVRTEAENEVSDPSVSDVKSMNRVPEGENRAEVLRVVVGWTHFILLSVTSLS